MEAIAPLFGLINTLYHLVVDEHPEKKWCWYTLSSNPQLTPELLDHIISIGEEHQLSWYDVSRNPSIPIEYVMDNLHLPWCWEGLTRNPNVTMKFIKDHPKNPWVWRSVSKNPNITEEFIESHSEIFWIGNWMDLFDHPNSSISMSFLEQKLEEDLEWGKRVFDWDLILDFALPRKVSMDFVTEHLDHNWNWDNISKSQNVTMEYILSHPELPWVWRSVSKNPNVTMEYVKRHPDLPWDYTGLSANPNLTMEFLGDNLSRLWNWSKISKNPNLTLEFIEAHPEKSWIWERISRIPNLTLEFVEKHIEKGWDFYNIAENPSIRMTKKFIKTHFPIREHQEQEPLGWIEEEEEMVFFRGLSRNPNLNVKLIRVFKNKPWDWRELSKNRFNYANDKVRIRLAKREGFILLEEEQTFHKLMNLHVIKKYM